MKKIVCLILVCVAWKLFFKNKEPLPDALRPSLLKGEAQTSVVNFFKSFQVQFAQTYAQTNAQKQPLSELSMPSHESLHALETQSVEKKSSLQALPISKTLVQQILEEHQPRSPDLETNNGHKDVSDEPHASHSSSSGGGLGGGGSAAKKTTNKPNSGPFSYKVIAFSPGEGGGSATDLDQINQRVVGPPDFSTYDIPPKENTLVSLGKKGSITLEIEGFLFDEAGADFVVFENPFVDSVSQSVYQETAQVFVAHDLNDFRSFPCDSKRAPFAGCAGVVPVVYKSEASLTQVGGDVFDLSTVGFKKIKYIKIQDTGDNLESFAGKMGFDLDAIALIHAP